MKRFLLLMILISLTIISSFAALNGETLVIETIVPENYGIHTPDDAIELGQFVFSFETDAEIGNLLTEQRLKIDNIEEVKEQCFTLLYYGNLSQDYNVQISIDTGLGFNSVNSASYIPVEVRFEEPEEKPNDIIVIKDEEYSKASVIIPPTGPRRGVETLDMIFSWSDVADAMPGRYEMDINIELVSNV